MCSVRRWCVFNYPAPCGVFILYFRSCALSPSIVLPPTPLPHLPWSMALPSVGLKDCWMSDLGDGAISIWSIGRVTGRRREAGCRPRTCWTVHSLRTCSGLVRPPPRECLGVLVREGVLSCVRFVFLFLSLFLSFSLVSFLHLVHLFAMFADHTCFSLFSSLVLFNALFLDSLPV